MLDTWKGRQYNFQFNDPSKPVRTFRTRRPSHFIFEIESFDKLEEALIKTGKKVFETPQFTVGSENWSLCIHPNGHVSKGGTGHVSLFLKRIKVRGQRSKEVEMCIKFFILDQIGGEYLVIEDLGEKYFDVRGNEWGIPQALRRVEFENEDNGFLIDNSCTFGVEIFSTNSSPFYSKMSFVKSIPRRIFDVGISLTAAATPADALDSSTFIATFNGETFKWKLQLYRQGYDEGSGSHISIYLTLLDTDKLSNGRSLLVNFDLSLKSKLTGQYQNVETKQDWYTNTKDTSGFPTFIGRRDFFSSSNDYAIGDYVDVKVHFNSVFILHEGDA